MSEIDLSDYVAGGYFITKYTSDGFWHSSLLPDRLVSLSECIGKPLQVYWGWDVEKYREEALNFGIPVEKLAAFKEWSIRGADFPGVFLTLSGARQFIERFLSVQANPTLIGAALPKEMVDEFLSDNKQQVFDANQQVLRQQDVFGVNRVLGEGKPLESDGDILGFEVVSYPGGFSHSWLCGNIEKDMHELFGIHPNQYGLINTYEEAKKVYDWIAEDEMKGTRAEPLPYYPWLLVQYPLAASRDQ